MKMILGLIQHASHQSKSFQRMQNTEWKKVEIKLSTRKQPYLKHSWVHEKAKLFRSHYKKNLLVIHSSSVNPCQGLSESGALSMRQEYSLNGKPVQCRTPYTYIFTSRGNLSYPIHLLLCFWEVTGNRRFDQLNIFFRASPVQC